MLVPRSFQYAAGTAASPPTRTLDEKRDLRRNMTASRQDSRRRSDALRTSSPAPTPTTTTTTTTTTTQPVRVPTPPIPVPTSERTHSAPPHTMAKAATYTAPGGRRRKLPAHDPNALPPSVAALLAVTQIPRPKPGQFRRQRSAPKDGRTISIDELVSEWKKDVSLPTCLSSSPALGILLEDADTSPYFSAEDSATEDTALFQRSTSLDSVPSLDADDRSVLSNSSLSTPESLRSKKSISNLKKASPRSVPASEQCTCNHPLDPTLLDNDDEDPDEGLILSLPPSNKTTPPRKAKSTFTSNLTTSLQALKNKALNSISSLSFSGIGDPNAPHASRTSAAGPFSDDVLWSHPFLFPRFSPEIRPAVGSSTTTPPPKSQRRHLKPTPLTFEEQEAPYQEALHAPFLAQRIESAPTIQMQTYGRGKRKSKRGGPDPQSEAGRALLGDAGGLRPREIRENGDFLRMVVLEMNMKRNGKLETGKAKIWLPPRQVGGVAVEMREGKGSGVPRRWVGISPD